VKDIALQITQEAKGEKLHILREYVQNYILFLMQKLGMSSSLYFVGGTALRFLYRIRRYSEDLDFSAPEDWSASDLSNFMKKIAKQLEKSGYSCTINIKDRHGVKKAVIGFIGLIMKPVLLIEKNKS
jgi:predicted nucleotidyltransferase component of viral defense system